MQLLRAARHPRQAARAARRRWRDRRFVSPLRADPAAPTVVLSPHLDDAVINCFSVLTSGESVRVVNVFAGVPEVDFIPTWDRICGARDIAAHVRERIDEDRAALSTLGIAPLNLPFLDGQNYRPGGAHPALSDVAAAIAHELAAASRIFAPAMMGDPIEDHVLVRSLALALRTPGTPVTLYADVPYAIRFGWPHWVTGTERNPRVDVDVFWSRFLGQLPELQRARVRVAALTPDQARHKLETMRLYRTQFEGLDALGVLSDPAIHSFEVFWEL
jgi:LmbE family N-acetylglucosaminyl deacetylase